MKSTTTFCTVPCLFQALSIFQQCLNSVLWVFDGFFKDVGSCKSVLKNFKGIKKEVSKKCHMHCSSKKFQWCLNRVLRVFDKILKMFPWSFREGKWVLCFRRGLRKFYFVIFLLHGSHHSYPSRRRAC